MTFFQSFCIVCQLECLIWMADDFWLLHCVTYLIYMGCDWGGMAILIILAGKSKGESLKLWWVVAKKQIGYSMLLSKS